MTVIGDFSFPGEHFVLNRTIDIPELDIEIERMVAHVDEGLTPYFRISSDDMEEVDRKLREDPTVENVKQLESFDDERFYRAHWEKGSHGLMTVLQRTNGAITSATYHEGDWEVRLLFKDRDNLTDFFEQCRDELDFSISLIRVFDRSNPATYGEYGLTEEQRDALLIALEAGYFDVPKRSDVEEIAGELDVSPQAVSQRLRRGYRNLIMNTIGTHDAGKE